MAKVSPQEAARQITIADKDFWQKTPPDVRREINFVKEVCGVLGYDGNDPSVFAYVAQAVKDAGIDAGAGEEYPKMCLDSETGKPVLGANEQPIVFQNAEEEAAWAKPVDEPVPAAEPEAEQDEGKKEE